MDETFCLGSFDAMTQDLNTGIQSQLLRYLAQEIPLERFREWFDVTTWDKPELAGSSVQRLAGQIDLRIAEYTSGHWTEDELRSKLAELLGRVTVSIRFPVTSGFRPVITGTCSAPQRLLIPLQLAGTRPVKVFS